jgi:nickel-dependent lactate racemase
VVEIWLPYGSSEIPARLPEERLAEILKPNKSDNISDPAAEAKRLIESSSGFLDAAIKARRLCVVLGPSSKGQLTRIVAQSLVESLMAAGVPPSSVTILRTEDAHELDPGLVDVRIVPHSPLSSKVVPITDPKCDFPLSLNSIFADADFRVLLGELKPHYFLKYSGLSDIVFPGLASSDSAQSQLSDRKGVTVSDLHKERVEVANSFKNTFALGFVLDADLSPAKMSLGNFQTCLEDLEKVVQSVSTRRVGRPADIVVMSAGGKPTDESLVSAMETLPVALPALKRDGALIVAAECPLGHGNTDFYKWCAEHKEPRYLEARLKHSFNYQGLKAAFLMRALENHRIYLVSTVPAYYVQNVFGMRAAATVNSALHTIQRSVGSNFTISVIPDASRIVTSWSKSDDA